MPDSRGRAVDGSRGALQLRRRVEQLVVALIIALVVGVVVANRDVRVAFAEECSGTTCYGIGPSSGYTYAANGDTTDYTMWNVWTANANATITGGGLYLPAGIGTSFTWHLAEKVGSTWTIVRSTTSSFTVGAWSYQAFAAGNYALTSGRQYAIGFNFLVGYCSERLGVPSAGTYLSFVGADWTAGVSQNVNEPMNTTTQTRCIDIRLDTTPTVSTFSFTEDYRRVVEVVGKAGTQATAETYLKVGGTNVQVDWRIRSYDSEQRFDNAKSRVTSQRNEVTYTDCVAATAYDVVPWESNDLPSTQWKVRFELLGTQWSGGCTGGTEAGELQIPKVGGIVYYDPITGTCVASVVEDLPYFDETWGCAFVVVNGAAYSLPAATPNPTPTTIPAVGTATPAPTVVQQNQPDVAGAINRQTDTQRGWFGQITQQIGSVATAVTGIPQGVATAVGVPGAGYTEGKLAQVETQLQTKLGGAPGIASSFATGWAALDEPTCVGWSGFPVQMNWFGTTHTFYLFTGAAWDNVYCPLRVYVGLGLSAWFVYNSILTCYQLAKPGGK